MGVGKTTIGRQLATMMQRKFIDTDQLLEERTSVSISHIFEVEGEEEFRNRESQLLREVSERQNQVISTGGGIVLKPYNRELMANSGKVIYLRASFNILWNRLQGCRKRPLLQTAELQSKIRILIKERAPIYENVADIIMNINPESASIIARRIHKRIEHCEDS